MSKSIFPKKMGIITHSSVECFQECRVKYQYRYIREIVPTEPQTALDFGSAIHRGLEDWFKYGIERQAIGAALTQGAICGLSKEDQIKIQVMLEKYIEIYKTEDFEVVEIEKPFEVTLENPRTGKASRTFKLNGKIDGLVKIDNRFWILEHKTTSDITDSYIQSLDIKAQIAIYAQAMEKMGYPVKGAIYDILEKPGIRMGKGETDEEFEARKAELLAKSKTGKTTAKKKEAETVDDFMERCRKAVTAESFKRVFVELPIDRKWDAMDNLWRAAKDMIHPEIYPTTGNCVRFGKVCPYIELCRNKGDIKKCGDLYKSVRAYCELGGGE